MDSVPVYTFKVKLKPDLSSWSKGNMMIKELNTTFDKRTLQILARSVVMQYSNMAFDFDVNMDIQLGYFDNGEVLLPTKVSYRGSWNVPFKKEERSAFTVLHSGYHRPWAGDLPYNRNRYNGRSFKSESFCAVFAPFLIYFCFDVVLPQSFDGIL